MKKSIKQVSAESQRKYREIADNAATAVQCGRLKLKIRWMRPYTLERITDVSLSCKNDIEIPARTAALAILNGWLKIHLLYWLVWRYMYHCVHPEVIEEIVLESKKKGDSLIQTCLTSIILATVMRDSMMNMGKEEAERFLQEQRSGARGQSEKSTRAL